MMLRLHVIGVLRSNFERYGFEPLETPALEYAETLEGKFGEEADKLIYKFEDRGGRQVGLRYDLTVPMCRVVACYPDLVKPFKRYQIAPVWRAERPQKGRYREFWQCDADIVGSGGMLADAEVLGLVYTGLHSLGFTHFKTKVNNRKILVALAGCAGVPLEQAAGSYRAVDKLDRIGPDGVRQELLEEGIAPAVADSLLGLVRVKGPGAEMLAEMKERLAAFPLGVEGVAELEQVLRHVRDIGIPEESLEVDFSMVRGLEYYTGPIFETVVEKPRIGSIAGGGRYDKLVGLLGGGDYPAVGVAFGLERILDVMEELEMGPRRKTVAHVLVTVFDATTAGDSLRLASELRAAGIATEVYLKDGKLGNQLRYAGRKGMPLVLILGPSEIAEGVAVLRDMASQEQRGVPLGQVVEAVRQAVTALA